MTLPATSIKRIVLACSGDLTTSVAIPWLAARHDAEMVTVTVDVGQREALDDVRARALAAGAVRAHVIDAREEFAAAFLLPALQSGALDEDRPTISAALGRLIVAKHLVATAALEQAAVVAHGAADAETCDLLARIIRSLNPRLRVLAPARDWRLTRAAQIAYATSRDIAVLEPVSRPVAFSSNLWGRSAWSTGDVHTPLPAAAMPARARVPLAPAVAALRFERGVPVAVNDVDLPLVDLIGSLATIAGAHGVGQPAAVTRLPAGSRVFVDAPAAAVLRAGYRDLRAAVLPARKSRAVSDLAAEHARVIAGGGWFTPEREALDEILSAVRNEMSGSVRLELSHGTCRVTACDAAPAGRAVARSVVPRVFGDDPSPARA